MLLYGRLDLIVSIPPPGIAAPGPLFRREPNDVVWISTANPPSVPTAPRMLVTKWDEIWGETRRLAESIGRPVPVAPGGNVVLVGALPGEDYSLDRYYYITWSYSIYIQGPPAGNLWNYFVSSEIPLPWLGDPIAVTSAARH